MKYRLLCKRAIVYWVRAFIVTGAVLTASVVFIGLLVAGASIVGSLAGQTPLLDGHDTVFGEEESSTSILSIPITGLILGGREDISDPFGLYTESVTYGYEIKRQLMDASGEKSIAGVILEINSPGGTVYGSKAIADGISYFREKTGKPTASFVSGMAVSGSYWSGIAADDVSADAGTVIGSIGIVSGPFKYYNDPVAEDGGILEGGIVTNRGIETVMITAGKYKDIGNPFRRLTEEELAALQSMADNSYGDFVSYVSQRRGVQPGFLTETLGALVVDPKMAISYGLIDREESREDAYAVLARRAGLEEGAYNVIRRYQQRGFVDLLLGSAVGFGRGGIPCTTLRGILAYYGNTAELCLP